MAATGSHVMEKLKDETECCICTGTFVDPRILSCLHTFCRKCLETHAAALRRGPRQLVPCPVCRKDFSIPDSGLSGLQKNFLVERLIDIVKSPNSAKSESAGSPCEACLEVVDPCQSNAVPPAEAYCADCQQKLCNECTVHHRKNKMTKLHTVSQLRDKSKAKSFLQNCVKRCCTVHWSEIFVYCLDCMDDFCPRCSAHVHKGHRSSSRTKIVDDYDELVDSKVNEFADMEHLAQKRKEVVIEKEAAIIQQMDFLEKEVSQRSEQIKNLVDSHTKLLQDEITSKKQKILEDIKLEKEQLEQLQAMAIGCREDCVEKKVFLTIKSVILATDSLNAKAEALTQLSEVCLNHSEFRHVEVALRESDIVDFLGKSNVIGAVEVVERKAPVATPHSYNEPANVTGNNEPMPLESSEKDNLHEYAQNPKLIQTIKTKASKDDHYAVTGITVLNDELYIVHKECMDLFVYDAETFEFATEMEVSELNDPCDIVSCNSTDYLYVFDRDDDDEPYRIFCLDTEGQIVRRWKTGNSDGSLSITYDSNIIVAFRDRTVLKEYSSNGRLLGQLVIHVEDGIKGFLHAHKLPTGLFFISYCSELKRHGLILVDGNGDILKSLHDTEGPEIHLNVPCFFTVDEAGSVLLVDKQNRRVLLCSADLERSIELLTNYKGGLHYPLRVFLDELRGRLFVVDNWYDFNEKEFRNGRVRVFQARKM